ncbi:MAG: winged helix-turn-helix domain-containing protein [Paracoccaceae bacterium]
MTQLFRPDLPFRLGPWRVDPAARRIVRQGRVEVLRPKAMALLLVLAEAAPAPVARDRAIDRVWPGIFVGDESLTHAVAELRRALDQQGRGDGPIETIQKAGYRLTLLPEPDTAEPATIPRQTDALALIDAQLLVAEARRLRQRNGRGVLAEALRLCREAAAMAPDHAPVLGEFAMAAADCALFSPRERPDLPEAREVAARAVALRPDLSVGYMALGMVEDALAAPERATAAFGRALAIDPGNAECHYLMARMFYSSGDMRRAALAATEAARLRPDDYCAPYLAAGAFGGAGEAARAAEAARVACRRLVARRRLDGAEQRSENILGSLLARLGRTEAALRELGRYEGAGGLVTYYNAAAYAQAGIVDVALARLEENIETGYRNFRWIRHDPALAPLRGERAFRRLAGSAE